jgi:pimeloyl-ACP methyl ester carboxylesterase
MMEQWPMIRRWLLGFVVAFSFIAPAGVRAEEGFFDAKGVKIHYVVHGKGEPVVLVHGFAIDITKQWDFPGVTKALAKDFQVIALDNRGHGKSGKPHEANQYGLEMVEDVVRLLDHLKIQKAHVVGYSMGGAIALKLATMHPDRLLSVTLGGMGLLEPTKEPVIRALAESLENGKGMTPLLIWLTPEERGKPNEEQVKALNTFLMFQNDAKALAVMVRGAMNKKLEISNDGLKQVMVPMLAIIGEADPFKKHVDELKRRLPSLQVVVVEKGDHFSTIMSPLFTKSVKEFMVQHSSQPSTAKPVQGNP